MQNLLPWFVLLVYCVAVYLATARKVSPSQFFKGGTASGGTPGLLLVASSAAISWIFAKSIANAAGLAGEFGILGGIGYALYYLSFITAAVAIYFIRTRGGHPSLAAFLTSKYGPLCARLFLLAIAIRLFNEVWSNTKVSALYFGPEGSRGYWIAALFVTAFTVFYSLRGGLRSSLLTDGAQMVLAAILLVVILIALVPGLTHTGLPAVPRATRLGGATFCGLALVQVLSYPFHDPVLTDRAFITSPKTMVKAMLLAGLMSGSFILLFSLVGIYGRVFGLAGDPVVAVPAAAGLPMLMIFNAIMLTSAGSTLDSTFSSAAKLGARDWPRNPGPPTHRHVRRGRWIMVAIALFGNLPLLTLYLGDKVGPAIIAATTISGTMVMGLAPIFLLAFIRPAGSLSFHLAFWPGIVLGGLRALEGLLGISIFPLWLSLGTGKYALDFGINVYGLVLCTGGYLFGAAIGARVAAPAPLRSSAPASAPSESS